MWTPLPDLCMWADSDLASYSLGLQGSGLTQMCVWAVIRASLALEESTLLSPTLEPRKFSSSQLVYHKKTPQTACLTQQKFLFSRSKELRVQDQDARRFSFYCGSACQLMEGSLLTVSLQKCRESKRAPQCLFL